MKICYIITALGYGGAEKLLLNTCNLLAFQNSISIIYLKDITDTKEYYNPNVKFYFVPLGISTSKKIYKLILNINPDVVHTHLGHADLIGLWAVKNIHVKKFCTMHNIWFKFSWIDSLIFTLYKVYFKTIAKDCKVISISKSVKSHVENCLKVFPSNSILLYNAIPDLKIEENKNSIRKRLQIKSNEFCILFVGRLEKQKSVQTLLRALSVIDSGNEKFIFKLIIIGEGRKEKSLISLVNELNLNDKVEFRGTIKIPEEYFKAADVFILPSIFEGMGIVILEAFRAGLPTIASDIEGPAELIKAGENGLLFSPSDYEDLATKIIKLYHDEDLRKTFAYNGLELFKMNYIIDKYCNELFNYYKIES